MNVFTDARQNMVDSQLRPNRVTDRLILAAMAELPRERFVPRSKQGTAYIDEDIEVAPGRFLMEPVVVARLLQALELTAETTGSISIGASHSMIMPSRDSIVCWLSAVDVSVGVPPDASFMPNPLLIIIQLAR